MYEKREISTACNRDRDYAEAAPEFTTLLRASARDLSPDEIAANNLTCALGLPGAEDLSIPQYLRRLDDIVRVVRRETEREVAEFRRDRGRFRAFAGRSEAFYRAVSLVTILKRKGHLRYNPEITDDERFCRIGYADSGDLLINGLLGDRRIGTCSNIPVLLVAVGRRLGYPLFVSANRRHVFARWDGIGPGTPPEGERFNIEASCAGVMGSKSDEEYRDFPSPMEPWEAESGHYLNNFTPAVELALALYSRCLVLQTIGRFEESLPAWAKCCSLAPAEPYYPRRAMQVMLDATIAGKEVSLIRIPRAGWAAPSVPNVAGHPEPWKRLFATVTNIAAQPNACSVVWSPEFGAAGRRPSGVSASGHDNIRR